MSYILDALKRADAERGEHRTHALSVPGGTTSIPGGAKLRPAWAGLRIWVMLAAAVLVMGAVALAWQRWQRPAAEIMPVEPVAAPGGSTDSRAAVPPTAETPAPAALPATSTDTLPSPSPSPPPPPSPASASAPAPVLPILAKTPPAPPPPPSPAASAKPTPGKTPATQPPPPNTVEAPSEPPAPTALPALSAAARAALPPIQVSGSSYSANREHRMLIANGQVIKEGQELSPGLTLEVIGPRSAVFNHGGTRFNINY